MQRLLTPLLLSLVLGGCAILDGPVPSVIEPDASPNTTPADLLVFTYPDAGDLVWGLADKIGGDVDANVYPYVLEILRRGYELAIAETGGVVAGLRVELISALPDAIIDDPARYGIDLASDSSLFAPAALALLQTDDRLVAALGPHHSDAVSDRTIRILCEAGLPMVSGFQGVPAADEQQCPESRFFRTSQSLTIGAKTAAAYLSEEGAQRALLVVSKHEEGESPLWEEERAAFLSEARQQDLEVIGELVADKLTIEQVRSSGADAIALVGSTGEQETRRFWNVFRQLDRLKSVVTESAAGYAFASFGGTLGIDRKLVVASNYPNASEIPGYAAFVERWVDRYGSLTEQNDEYIAMSGYAAMRAILAAIERVVEEGINDPTQIRALLPSRLSSLEFSGEPFGVRWGFTGSGRCCR